MSATKLVLFVCVENSNRSQMAEAFARMHGAGLVEACSAGSRPSGRVNPKAIAVLTASDARSPLATGPVATGFTDRAIKDCLHRLAAPDAPRFGKTELVALAEWAQATGAQAVVTPYAPIGPIARLLRDLDPLLLDRGMTLHRLLRGHDRDAWPHATGGFFKFREGVMG